MTAYTSLKAAHLQHRIQTVQASKDTVDAALKAGRRWFCTFAQYRTLNTKLSCYIHMFISTMGLYCTLSSLQLHRVVPLSRALLLINWISSWKQTLLRSAVFEKFGAYRHASWQCCLEQKHIHCIHALFESFIMYTGLEVICSTYLFRLTRAGQRPGEKLHANVPLHHQRAPTLRRASQCQNPAVLTLRASFPAAAWCHCYFLLYIVQWKIYLQVAESALHISPACSWATRPAVKRAWCHCCFTSTGANVHSRSSKQCVLSVVDGCPFSVVDCVMP
jgi:hypothetical protein